MMQTQMQPDPSLSMDDCPVAEEQQPQPAPKAPANNLEQFCLLLCRGLEVKKVSTNNPGKSPYSRIIWMCNDRTALCYGKAKNAPDAVEVPLTSIMAVLPDKRVSQRFMLVTPPRSLLLDVDTANSRDILVRMVGSLVTQHQSKEKKRGQVHSAFKASCCNAVADCPICLSELARPLQLRCGHTYCQECIDHWRAESETAAVPSCPSCREPLPPGATELLGKAVMFLDMRNIAPKKRCPESTVRSFRKKTKRAMALIQESHNLNPVAKYGALGYTAMSLAAAYGDAATVRAFAKRESERSVRLLDTPDASGATPLHLGVHEGNLDTVAALLSLGADVKAYNNNGHSALELAISAGHNSIKIALEEAGATISKRAYAAALRKRRASIRLLRRPLWDIFGCYVSRGAQTQTTQTAHMVTRYTPSSRTAVATRP